MAAQVRRDASSEERIHHGLRSRGMAQVAGRGRSCLMADAGTLEARTRTGRERAGLGRQEGRHPQGKDHAHGRTQARHPWSYPESQRPERQPVRAGSTKEIQGVGNFHTLRTNHQTLCEALHGRMFRRVDAVPGRQEGVERQVRHIPAPGLESCGSGRRGDRGRAHAQFRDAEPRDGRPRA